MKKILITGCGSGLGREAAIALASRGHYVYATTHTKEQADNLNILNQKYKLPLESFKLDLLCRDDRLKVTNIRIDILVNNAAIGDSGSVAEMDINLYKNTFETNVFCPIELTQLVLKQMIPRKKQYGYFKLTEFTNLDSIIDNYIKAVEDKYPKERYIAPASQGAFIKIKNTLLKK